MNPSHLVPRIICIFVVILLASCATRPTERVTKEQILEESKGRLKCYEKGNAELERNFKEGKISKKAYEENKETLRKLSVKEMKLQLKINEEATPDAEIEQSARELAFDLEAATKTSCKYLLGITLKILEATIISLRGTY